MASWFVRSPPDQKARRGSSRGPPTCHPNGRGHCVLLLCKALNSHSVYVNKYQLGGRPVMG